MEVNDVTFASPLGEWLAPVLIAIRATGFFEWYVFMPVMTVLSVVLYVALQRRIDRTDGLRVHPRREHRLWRAAYYSVCFMLTNSLAVALKTLIVEEMDYAEPVWFLSLVAPLHFYIVSVAAAYLWLIARSRVTPYDQALAAYVQVGLLGGYAVAVYRILYESFSAVDPTTAFGGVLLMGLFLSFNLDVWRRVRGSTGRQPAFVGRQRST